jgi:hypothetical protein
MLIMSVIPSLQAKFRADRRNSVPTRRSIPFALAELHEAKSIKFARILKIFFPSLWVALVGREIRVPAGIVTPLENVNGRNAMGVVVTSEK